MVEDSWKIEMRVALEQLKKHFNLMLVNIEKVTCYLTIK